MDGIAKEYGNSSYVATHDGCRYYPMTIISITMTLICTNILGSMVVYVHNQMAMQ
jgi:hypothetical protein